MGDHTRKRVAPHKDRPVTLGELIHAAVRRAIEVAVQEELAEMLGATPYERCGSRCGYRNGTKPRTLTGPTGPLALAVPRGHAVHPRGPAGADVGSPSPVPATSAGSQRGGRRHLPGRREHTPPPRGARPAPQGGPAVEERGVADRGHPQDGPGAVAHPIARRAAGRLPPSTPWPCGSAVPGRS